MSRLTNGFSSLSIQLVVCLSLLLLLEQALRLWFPLEISQAKQQNYSQNIAGLKPEITYRRDRFGLRSLQAIAAEKPAKQIRILCLGSSTTEQTTQETEDTWCGILEAELKKNFPKDAARFQTMAFGEGGHRAVDSAFWLRENIERIKPDVVITLLGINDLTDNGGKNYQYQNIEPELSKRAQNKHLSMVGACKAYSQICHHLTLVKEFISTQLASRNGKILEWHSANLPELRETLRHYPEAKTVTRKHDPFNEFQDASSWIAEYLKRREVKLIMLGHPVVWHADMPKQVADKLWLPVSTLKGRVRTSGKWLHQEVARYNTAQKQIAQKSGAYYLDLDALIPKNLNYYFDDCHYTDQGSRKVAMSIMPILIEALETL